MSNERYQYYSCDDESLIADILRAAINTEHDHFELDVYSRSASGGIRCQSTSNSMAGNTKAIPGASFGLSASVMAAVACILFLPLLKIAGIEAYAALVFIVSMIGAWAGGSFSRTNLPSRLRKALAKLGNGQLIIACRASPTGQEGVRQALGRYSRVLPLNAKLELNDGKETEPGQDFAS